MVSLQIPAAIRSALSQASKRCVNGANGIPLRDSFSERTITEIADGVILARLRLSLDNREGIIKSENIEAKGKKERRVCGNHGEKPPRLASKCRFTTNNIYFIVALVTNGGLRVRAK